MTVRWRKRFVVCLSMTPPCSESEKCAGVVRRSANKLKLSSRHVRGASRTCQFRYRMTTALKESEIEQRCALRVLLERCQHKVHGCGGMSGQFRVSFGSFSFSRVFF